MTSSKRSHAGGHGEGRRAAARPPRPRAECGPAVMAAPTTTTQSPRTAGRNARPAHPRSPGVAGSGCSSAACRRGLLHSRGWPEEAGSSDDHWARATPRPPTDASEPLSSRPVRRRREQQSLTALGRSAGRSLPQAFPAPSERAATEGEAAGALSPGRDASAVRAACTWLVQVTHVRSTAAPRPLSTVATHALTPLQSASRRCPRPPWPGGQP